MAPMSNNATMIKRIVLKVILFSFEKSTNLDELTNYEVSFGLPFYCLANITARLCAAAPTLIFLSIA
jgi:hypothetical protein